MPDNPTLLNDGRAEWICPCKNTHIVDLNAVKSSESKTYKCSYCGATMPEIAVPGAPVQAAPPVVDQPVPPAQQPAAEGAA